MAFSKWDLEEIGQYKEIRQGWYVQEEKKSELKGEVLASSHIEGARVQSQCE